MGQQHITKTPPSLCLLLNAGADPNARTEEGKTPGDLAQKNEALKGTEAYRRLNDGS